MFPDLEKALGEKLPKPTELDTEAARQQLDALCVKNNVECSAPRTAARLLDKVCEFPLTSDKVLKYTFSIEFGKIVYNIKIFSIYFTYFI